MNESEKVIEVPYDVLATALTASNDPNRVMAIARAILQERERCAKIAEDTGRSRPDDEGWWFHCADVIARKIRNPES